MFEMVWCVGFFAVITILPGTKNGATTKVGQALEKRSGGFTLLLGVSIDRFRL